MPLSNAPVGRLLGFAVLAQALTIGQLGAQTPTQVEGLGSLSFPNSGSAAAQAPFLRGVLLLHSFEYDFAAEAFREAQAIDPAFAMAYWGEAMTHTHAVWNEKDPAAARAVLRRFAPTPEARAARAPTARERGYLEAIDVLYGDGPKARLDTLYAERMENLAREYPDDLEARAFHALALLGLSQGDRDVPTYMRAGAIALDVFNANPGHPGAAHYVIHAFDDPVHAPLAMNAARAYGPIAPRAGHAQHMTTHIFLAMGMWNDVVEANLRADAVVDGNLAEEGLPPTYCGHYNFWLAYGYQQLGRYEDAGSLLAGCRAQAADPRFPQRMRNAAASSWVMLQALYLADTRQWDGEVAATDVELPGAGAAGMLRAWTRGMIAAHNGDIEAATSMRRLLENAGPQQDDFMGPYVPVWAGTLSAAVARAEGRMEDALRAAHRAAEHEASMPVDFGPPLAAKPARELEAEILLDMGRGNEAMAAFAMALARTPNRTLALRGFARAAELAGQPDAARTARRQLAALLDSADPGVAEKLLAGTR